MTIKPHAFVAMPFGTKKGSDGTPVDFNRIYAEYIAPAVKDADLEVFRADQELRAGEIRTDMFQELLLADLVVADISVDNPNVWYELGVRHALRARGVVLVCHNHVTAFDVYTDRKLHYSIKAGAPDPDTLKSDRQKLTQMLRATMESWHGRKVSPVYDLLPNLQEPDWKALKIGNVREFWEKHDAWVTRIDLARKRNCIGDLLVLAEEAPVAAFRAEAWAKAGVALRKAERFYFALEHLEKALAVDPTNLPALREKGMCLQRLALQNRPGHSPERAREHYLQVLQAYPNDVETLALLGRVEKDAWTQAWHREGRTTAQMRDDAAYEDGLLRAAIDAYSRAFHANPAHYYSGINALTLKYVARDLLKDETFVEHSSSMAGAVRFSAEAERDPHQVFWAKVTLGDFEVLAATPKAVADVYKAAIAKADKDWFALSSSLRQLQLLRDLGFRPEAVAAGIETFERALARLSKPEDKWEPRHVLLFSGHRVDAPGRAEPRFPAEKEPIAAARIEAVLDELGAGPDDLAFCQGAAGGDILFLEACQKRGVHCQLLLPLPEPEFVRDSIMSSANGEGWRRRFYEVKGKVDRTPRFMPDELGPSPKDANPFERCNLWLLYSALACGVEKVRFITLWNGNKAGDGPGGTAHMYDAVQSRTGRVHWIDSRAL